METISPQKELNTRVRLAHVNDVEAIMRCAVAAYTIYIDLLGRMPTPMQEDYRALVERSQVHVLECSEGVVGFIVIFVQEEYLMLDNAAVLPGWQGKSLGRMFLRYAEEMARRLGLKRLRLHTNALMTHNIELYGKNGFSILERKMENGIDRVYMEKSL